jgi:UDP-N-acetyl-D-glucosamine dehydrogenase
VKRQRRQALGGEGSVITAVADAASAPVRTLPDAVATSDGRGMASRGTPAEGEDARRRSTDRRVAVVGLGYTGLPLAIAFIEAGLEVEGIDALPTRVAELNARMSPIDDIDDERLGSALDAGLKVAGPLEARVAEADVIFVCVPTPITAAKDPDITPVLTAAAFIRDSLRPGQLIILQSTTYPGTTTGPFRGVLEGSGLVAGQDFDLAFAPERVNPGDPGSPAKDVPRLVGGITPAATERAARLLEHVNDRVIRVSSPEAAELAKLLENVFRYVNIAFVNQLALLCERMGLDVWEVIDAAATKPFGFMRFTPGPGVGGHCIPVDSYYLSWRAREFGFVDRFIEAASDINAAMPRHVVDLTAEALNDRGKALKGARVGLIGVAFKPDIRDARNSPAADVMLGLAERGAEVRYHDPHVSTFRDAAGHARESVQLDRLIDWADVVVVVTGHRSIDWTAVYDQADLIVDTVNSAARRQLRARQVLRLGAGWAPA